MPRLPLLSGSRVVGVQVPEGAVVLRAPPPLEPLADVGSAVGEALRFPIAGLPLEALTTRGGRATVIVDPPVLPFPGAQDDPRRDALSAVLAELRANGVPSERQTVLVAGGLERRAGRKQLERLLRPAAARAFHGTVAVHDVEGELRPLGQAIDQPVAVAPTLLDTDLVVVVSSAETVLHGGAAVLLGACGPQVVRAGSATSLLEPATSSGWRLAIAVEQMLARRTPLLSVSLVLDHPRPAGRYRGWPSDQSTVARVVDSPARHMHNIAPGPVRHALFRSLDVELNIAAALAGPPSVAHTEALLRGTELRAARLDGQLDVLVVPVPWVDAHQPRTGIDPIGVSYVALGLALRSWRERSPLARGGTVVLLHHLRPTFDRATRSPYRALFEALRDPSREHLHEVERTTGSDRRALEAYRAGHAPHPLLAFADWAACIPVIDHAGRVIVGGCRDAVAARRLGFVPSHSPQAALEMALGVAGQGARVGVLLAPPYAPVIVS